MMKNKMDKNFFSIAAICITVIFLTLSSAPEAEKCDCQQTQTTPNQEVPYP